jgi:hypothetical protein
MRNPNAYCGQELHGLSWGYNGKSWEATSNSTKFECCSCFTPVWSWSVHWTNKLFLAVDKSVPIMSIETCVGDKK